MRNATTVAGVTSNPLNEYTPTVMRTSCTSAASVGTAILNSNRSVMYSVITIRNTISALRAFWLISLPHDGPTSSRFT